MGAICIQEHSEKLQSLVNDAYDKGAEIIARGSFGNLGEDAVDQFFPPTVIVNVSHSMKLMQEEVRSDILLYINQSYGLLGFQLFQPNIIGLICASPLVVNRVKYIEHW